LHLTKNPRDLFSPCIFQLLNLCAQNLSERQGRAKRLIVVSCNPRKTNMKVFFLGLQRTMMSVALDFIFCRNFIRTTKDENECNTHNYLLCKGIQVNKKQRKKKVDVHSLATDALVIFWRSVFCNTTSTMSSVALLQHRLCNIVFCSNTSMSLL